MYRSSDIDPDALFTEGDAAELLAVSKRTLQAWRLKGGGPVYVRCGRAVRYRRKNLIEWMEERSVRHTSEHEEREHQ